ncbi:HesB-like domain-containing protein [Cardiosporidium cionae]|uniref:HesB-like domain-containing protein n=1 Tax=Cardiosporidium cionae TaxID=476202 RepID=A0ABQ7JCG8_9APIC|nr:HesB-like domain-containing protein [Cardiosporidium cionae]|eukprot:KAF8821721.1 HesB-like domain-containing protein [Cardiosporidium cionae]
MRDFGLLVLGKFYVFVRAPFFWSVLISFLAGLLCIISGNLALLESSCAKPFLPLGVVDSYQRDSKVFVQLTERRLSKANLLNVLSFTSILPLHYSGTEPQFFPKARNSVYSPASLFAKDGATSEQLGKRIIRVSSSAASHIKSLKEKRSQTSKFFLRMGVKSGGCSGLSYTMDQIFLDDISPSDYVEEYPEVGFHCVIDPKSMLYMFGMELDYSDALIGGGFRFHNPNAARSCGCGMSFGVSRNFGIDKILSKPQKCSTNNATHS